MAMDYDELSYNFGCGSCGYKLISGEASRRGIPVSRVIEKLDGYFAQNDLTEAGKLLTYWRAEAVSLGDRSGELSIVNEQLGFSRRSTMRIAASKLWHERWN